MTRKLKKVTFSRTNYMQYFETENEPDPLRIMKEKGIFFKSQKFILFNKHLNNLFWKLHQKINNFRK